MKDPKVSYFFKKFYRNIIKWWFVIYNPVAKKIWPSKEEEEAAKEKEEEERKRKEEEEAAAMAEEAENAAAEEEDTLIVDDTYNATTGSFSGRYGQKPVDSDTQAALDEIMGRSSSQSSVDFLLQGNNITEEKPKNTAKSDVVLPPEQDAIIQEANAIYERLLREAAEDEAKKQAEIEAAKLEAAKNG